MIVLDLDKELQPGYYNLSISYGSLMRSDLMGCYLSYTEDNTGNKVPFLTSQFEPNYARTCIPTFDEPDIKMSFDVTVSIPAEMDFFFNTQPLSTELFSYYDDSLTCLISSTFSFIRFL